MTIWARKKTNKTRQIDKLLGMIAELNRQLCDTIVIVDTKRY